VDIPEAGSGEPSDVADAVVGSAATLVLNDDVDGAEAGLDQGNSTYHKVCELSGVVVHG